MELSFSMSYLRSAERLTVVVGQLKGAKKNIKASSYVYVKATILENEKKVRKRKTSTVAISSSTSSTNMDSNNVLLISVDWQESLSFDISKDKLQSGLISIELTLYGSEHFFIPAYSSLGSIKFGPKDPLDPDLYQDKRQSLKDSSSAVEFFNEDSEEERDDETPWWETILGEKYQSFVEFYRLQ